MKETIIEEMISEYNTCFQGWDFSYLSKSGRMKESVLTWNYQQIIERNFDGKKKLLDMGTGGGEFLTSLKSLPPNVYTTEGYEPNLSIARNRLKSINAEVKFIAEDNKIPYEDKIFDIIINRHEEYDPIELYRVLNNDGLFITQQVGGMNDFNLNISLCAKPSVYYSWNLFSAIIDLEKNGFAIVRKQESYGFTRFYDIGAISYYLKCIPWQIDDFSVEKYQDQLFEVHKYIEENGFFDLINHRFLIIAKKRL